MAQFQTAKAKLGIQSLDEEGLYLLAQYNPKELQVDQTVGWQALPPANNVQDAMALQFGGAQPQTLKVELLFDGCEAGWSVLGQIETLRRMASVRVPDSNDETERRPHYLVVAWGGEMPKLQCVIESLSTKYTMWDDDGRVLRATVTVSLKEAARVDGTKEKRPPNRVAAPAKRR